MATKITMAVATGILLFAVALPVGVASQEPSGDVTNDETLELRRQEFAALLGTGRSGEDVGSGAAPLSQVAYEVKDGSYEVAGEAFHSLVRVQTTDELAVALASAIPGTMIELLPGQYLGSFRMVVSGEENAPIAIVGTRDSVLTTGRAHEGPALSVTGSNVRIHGVGFSHSWVGVEIDGGAGVSLRSLEFSDIDESAVVVLGRSSDVMLTQSYFHRVGGTHAVQIEPSTPRSGGFVVSSNFFGPDITTALKIGPNATSGEITNNSFISTNSLHGNIWVELGGSGFSVSGNRAGQPSRGVAGDYGYPSLVHDQGTDNHVEGNPTYSEVITAADPYFIDDGIRGRATLWLPKRSLPYSLSEILARFPEVGFSSSENSVVIQTSIYAGPGAELHLTNYDSDHVRLLSDTNTHVAVAGFQAELLIQGSAERKLRVESWDLSEGTVDGDLSDGRSFVVAFSGEMNVAHAEFVDLGYEEGVVSGVAWKGVSVGGEKQFVSGTAKSSLFAGNFFGAYTFEAEGMAFVGNVFRDNVRYGFDPHDFSNNFVVEHNVASNNGSHGIIFSRGCEGNIIRFNTSIGNAGHGIMIDDGKHIPGSPDPRYAQPVPSSNNVIAMNTLISNNDGVVIEGGTGNVVRSNLIAEGHRYGIRLKDAVNGSLVQGNAIDDVYRSAFYVYNSSSDNTFLNNAVAGSPAGIVVGDSDKNLFADNDFARISRSAIEIRGVSMEIVVRDNSFAGVGSDAFAGVTASEARAMDERNDLSDWRFPAPSAVQTLGVTVWLITLLLPVLVATFARAHYDLVGARPLRGRHSKPRRRYARYARKRPVARSVSSSSSRSVSESA